MKLIWMVLAVACIAVIVQANEDKITEEEVQELINGYKDFSTNDGKSAPVSWTRFLSLQRFQKSSLDSRNGTENERSDYEVF